MTKTLFTINVVTESEVYDFGFFHNRDAVGAVTDEVLVIGEEEDPIVPFTFVGEKIGRGLSFPYSPIQ